MAYSFAVEELRTGRTMRFTGGEDSISIGWNREFRVKVSGTGGDKPKDVDPFSVITASGLPIVNRSIYVSQNRIIPFLICRDKAITQTANKADEWKVQTSYKSIDKNREESNNQPIDPPAALTDITPTEQPSLGEIQRVLYEDKADPAQKILLPSGAHFSEPVMERIPTLTVRLTQYEASITYEQMLERKFKTNSGTYRSKPRYQWLIEDVEATEVDVQLAGGLTSAALVTYTLTHLPLAEGWKKALALIDYKHLVGGKFKPYLEGSPRTASQTFVDSTGVRKVDQSAPDYIEFEPQGDIDFGTFLQAQTMAGIGFKDPNIAKRLKQIALTPDGLTGDEGLRHSDAYFVKSPPGGVPAISGTALGSAECDCYQLAYDDVTGEASLELMTDPSGATITVTVHHAGPKPIGGDKPLIVAWMFGVYVPIVEYC